MTDDDLDIPMGGTAHLVVLILARRFDKDPLPWFDRVIARNEVRGIADEILADLISIDLETSTQIPDIRRGIELEMIEEGD